MEGELDQSCSSTEGKSAYIATLLDVECLDQTLFRLIEGALLPPFREAPSSTKAYAKLLAFPLIQFATIVATRGQTPAAQILKLEHSPGASNARSFSSRLIFFALLSSLIPTISDPLLKWLEARIQHRLEEHPVEESDISKRARERQRLVFTFTQKTMSRLFPVARLCCLLACWSGISRTPSVAMLVSGLGFQPKGPEKPRLHVDYAHRRWLQQEATSTAKIFLAGLWMLSSWKPVVDAFLLKTFAVLAPKTIAPQTAAPTTCPICKGEMNVPVLLSCRHKACYTCFYADLDSSKRASCRICRKLTHESRAVLVASS